MPPAYEIKAPLAALNTLRLPATAARLLRIDSPATLIGAAPAIAGERRRFILGGGSNLVLTGDVDGLVLQVALPGRRCTGEDAEAFYVTAGAGENWHDFVQWTLAAGYPGLENLALIPGTVGAAPIQNIGAYGLEIGERFAHLDALDLDSGQTRRFDAAACRFGYRDSVFKQEGWHRCGRYLITAVTFRLPKHWTPLTRYADVAAELDARGIARPCAANIAAAVAAIRRRKLPDPAAIPNAGSFFQNPVVSAAQAAALQSAYPALPSYAQADGRVKLAAGWLIEQAGWKGRNLGPVGMFEKQALILVNRGGATGSDVCALAAAVQADVRTRFGVGLEPEPIYFPA